MRFERKSSGGSEAGGWRRLVAILTGALLIVALFCGAEVLQRVSPASFSNQALDADHIYNPTNVWIIHLKFTPEQWEAMEPKGSQNPFGGGSLGGRQGGETGARSLAPAIMSLADQNRDGRISSDEFAQMAQAWFKAWDTNGAGLLNETQMRAGLEKIRNPAPGGIAAMLLAPDGKRNGISFALGTEFEYVHADLEFAGRLFADVGVRYKGNGTFMEARDSLKRSLKIDINKFEKEQSLGDVTMLTLQNNVTDASLMNEVLAYRLYRDADVPAPRTAYAKVFVTVPGKYDREFLGLYSMTEAVDKQFAKRHFGTKRGAIFKPVTPSLFTDLGADWAAYAQIYDSKVTLYEEQKKAVMELSRFVTRADDSTFAAHIGEFIDLPEFARFMAVMVYLSDLDGLLGPGQNLFLHLHPKSQQFQFIPWDQDHSWGQFNRASQEQREQLSIQHPWQGKNFFLERMFKVEAFKKLYLARLDEFSQTIFNPERLAGQVNKIARAIRPALQEESESKLARFDKLVAGETVSTPGPFGGSQTKPIKPFTKVRTQSVADQLAGKAEGLAQGNGFSFGPDNSNLGMFSRPLFQSLDENKDGAVSSAEFAGGFARLFKAWNSDDSGYLNLGQLRAGIAKDLSPPRPSFQNFGGGPPRDRRPPANELNPRQNPPGAEQQPPPGSRP
jgi:hypothetical protein